MSTIRDLVQKMLDKLWPELNDPVSGGKANPLYLPRIIQNQGYDPYSVGSWTLGTVHVGGDAGTQICGPAGIEQNQNWIASTNTPDPYIVITSATLTGVSNIFANTATAVGSGYTIVADAQLSVLPTHPQSSGMTLAPEIKLAGFFELQQWCCVTTDFTTCHALPPPPGQQAGHGTFKATIPKSSGTMLLEIASLAPNVFQLGVSTVNYRVETISFDAQITSVPSAQQQHWDSVANKALNSKEATKAVVSHINAVLNTSKERDRLAQALTKRIDQYLKDNHQYPFDNAYEAIF